MSFVFRRIISPSLQRNFLPTLKHIYTGTATKSDNNTSTAPQAKDAIGTTPSKQSVQEPKLVISDTCKARLREICQDGSFLRLTVEGGGCSGFQYKFDLDTKLNEDDLQFGEDDAKVVVDNVSMEYCAGATVDYHIELIRAGFKIVANPIAEKGCSCGSSFAIKMD